MAAQHQPFLHELVTTLAAPTQVLSGASGDVLGHGEPTTAQGVIHADVRALSQATVTVNGSTPEHVATSHLGSTTTFVSLIRDLGDAAGTPDPQLRLDRHRVVTPGLVSETLTLSSAMEAPVEIALALELRCDYAPIDAIKSGVPSVPRPIEAIEITSGLRWAHDDLELRLVAPSAQLDRSDSTAVMLRWPIVVPANGKIDAGWSLQLDDTGAAVVPAGGEPLAVTDLVRSSATTSAGDPRLEPWLERSLADLNSLRMASPEAPDDAFFAAGSPWYLTLFGRDSLWAARLLLPLDVAHAGSTLRALARRQGSKVDSDSAEQPGKILHELRRGQFGYGEMSLPPVYYGTVDATMLWICLLRDAWRAGLPESEVRELLPACQAALGWLTDYADADGDGFVEYIDSSGHGLANQGWKDSSDSIRFSDGTIATGSVALVEVQGYAYEAARSGAELLEAFGLGGAETYRAWADRLAERFRAAYWCGTGDDRYPALALDGDKRRVDAVTSNIGHLLGTGILSAEEEVLVARRLAAPDMDSGLGLRTMSSEAGGYWPLSYHCGSVWPHDTAIVIAGLTRAGLLAHAGGLIEGLLRA
ncbi:MAG: glycogen debranching N-terminal domain-containing protein, partial [Propionibacteriaceae bacterium]